MSRFIIHKACKVFFILLLSGISSTYLLAGQAERKNEAKRHISSQSKTYTPLSLDDVIPGEQSVFIKPSAEVDAREPVLIRVTGYSAFESEQDSKSESKRLLAQRASKLDAYRALSERVYGLSVKGQSTVKDFVLKEDSFSVGFDSFVRGARVVSINEKKGIGFETVLELVLPGSFEDCLNKVNNFKNGLNCLRPLPNSAFYFNDAKEENLKKTSARMNRNHGYFLQ